MSDAETKVEPTVDSSSRMSPRHNFKAELEERPASPDINCAICLEELRNKSFTNTCLHQFCFHCLLEWSKVKPECPLCKQGFSRIYHNIRSNQEYDEHVLETPMQSPALDPHIFINVAFQRHRFRYRSTMGGGSMMWAFQGLEPPMSMSTSWSQNSSFSDVYSILPPPRQGATTTRSLTRSQRIDSSGFRRNVYRQGLWVRPGSAARFRECSPEFFSSNPAQTHRLVPWLVRELNVLLDMQYDTHTVCQDILNLIGAHHINSSAFHRAMTFYLGSTAEHFIHEFYHFAISPHDMIAYDSIAQYAQVGREFSSDSDSDVEMINQLPEPLVSLDLTAAPGPSGLQTSVAQETLGAVPETSINASSPPNYIIIELSDDEEPTFADPDSDVEIIGQLPPRHLRTPEVITIESESDSEPERTVELKSEPLVDYSVISSGDEEDEEEEEEEEVQELRATEQQSFPSRGPAFSAVSCHCPLYDNCPYSREKMQLRYPDDVNSSSPFSSTASSIAASSNSTEPDDAEISDAGPSTSTGRRHKKLCTNSKKKSCKSVCKRIIKRKRSHESSRSSYLLSEDDSQMSTAEEDTRSSENNTRVSRKRRLPVRLKSIVLKVDRSKSSTSNSSSRYLRRHKSRRISSSESND